MQVTREMAVLAMAAYNAAKVHHTMDSSYRMQAALEVVFSLIERESAKREIIPGDIFDSFPPELPIMDEPDNDYWYKKYNEQFLEKDELKKFIAINCFNWRPYKSGLNAKQEIYAPCQDAADTVELGCSVWKLVDDMIADKKEAKERPDNEGWIQVARSGFAQPVNDEIIVEIKWSTTQIERGLAGSYDWNNSGACIPIIAYRILPNQTPKKEKIPTFSEWRIQRKPLNIFGEHPAVNAQELVEDFSEYLHKYMARK